MNQTTPPTAEQVQRHKEICMVTYKQISVGVRMRLGMREAIATNEGLRFRVGPGCKRLWLYINLDPSDTYTIRVVKMGSGKKRFEMTEIVSMDGVYCDNLDDCLIDAEREGWGS